MEANLFELTMDIGLLNTMEILAINYESYKNSSEQKDSTCRTVITYDCNRNYLEEYERYENNDDKRTIEIKGIATIEEIFKALEKKYSGVK